MPAMNKVFELKPAEYNPRKISPERLTQLAKSMAAFGDLSGIVFNRRTGNLVGGHQRVKQLDPSWRVSSAPAKDRVGTVALGYVETPQGRWSYREVDWDARREKAANVAANAAGGDFDRPLLKAVVLDLQKVGYDLDLLNLTDLDLLKKTKEPKEINDEVPKVSKGQSEAKRGSLYYLGDHRLLCGDATNRDDVDRLMGTDQAACVFTDPPYGVSYQSEKFDIIAGDKKRDFALIKLVGNALKQMARVARANAAFYIWHASGTRREFDAALLDAGLIEKQYLIWVKNVFSLGRADYQWAHEPCYYATKEGHAAAWHGGRAQMTVWRVTIRGRKESSTTLGEGLILTEQGGGATGAGAAGRQRQENAHRYVGCGGKFYD